MATLKEQFTFRIGDLNGTIQLFFDNLATLLALTFVLNDVLRAFNTSSTEAVMASFPEEAGIIRETLDDIIFGRTIPGLAITMIFGNVYYTWMGARLGQKEDRKGDVTALPYGVNTPGAFAFAFSVIAPIAGKSLGTNCPEFAGFGAGFGINDTATATAFAECYVQAAEDGWAAGVVGNLVAGIISVALGLFGNAILKAAPAVALLTSLAGIGFVFLGLAQVAHSYYQPIAGLLPLYLAFVVYFGDVSFHKFIPKSLLVVLVGTILCWADGIATYEGLEASTSNVKVWGIDTGFRAFEDISTVGDTIGTIIPVALAAAAGTLMNVLSAEQAGDSYGVAETMVSDGFGTMVAAFFGCPFGTSVYIGHPAYKKMGAGIMYSLMNCSIFFVLALFGLFAPIEAIIKQQAVAPLLLFVGLMICQEALAAAPVRQYPAVLFGLYPSLTDFAIIGGVNQGGIGGPQIAGLAAQSKGSLLLALVTVSIFVYIIERDFLPATLWTLGAAVLSAVGILHQERVFNGEQEWSDIQGVLYHVLDPIDQDLNCAVGDVAFNVNQGGVMKCPTDKTTQPRFMGAYLMVAAMLALMWFLQKRGLIAAKVSESVHEAEAAETAKSATVNTIKRASIDNGAPVSTSNPMSVVA